MNHGLISEIRSKFDSMIAEWNSIPQNELNLVPFEGSWTAGQVVEHIIKGNAGLPGLMMGATIPADRDPSDKIGETNKIFTDRTQKYKSPPVIEPTRLDNNKTEQISSLEEIKGSLTRIAETEDLSPVCLGFELPGFGKFTRLEWINFCLVHTERHTNQLHHIASLLKEKSGNSINH